MRKSILILFLIGLSSIHAFSNGDSTVNNIDLSVGGNGSWWKYNRGIGEGWDRTDYVMYYNVDLSYSRVIKKYELGLKAHYAILNELNIERFNDIPSERAKDSISSHFVQFYGLGIEASNKLLDYKKYNLLAGAGGGVFWINTVYEDKDRFGTKVYWNAFVKHQFLLKKDYYLSFKIEYEKKHIFVINPLEGEHHEISRLGVVIGIEKYF